MQETILAGLVARTLMDIATQLETDISPDTASAMAAKILDGEVTFRIAGITFTFHDENDLINEIAEKLQIRHFVSCQEFRELEITLNADINEQLLKDWYAYLDAKIDTMSDNEDIDHGILSMAKHPLTSVADA